MPKLQLKADPAFKAKVSIPRAGAEAVEVEFTFRHRTRAGLDEFIKSRDGKTDAQTFMDMVIAWELEDEFTPANVDLLLENYIGASLATFRTYVNELVKAKEGN